MLNILTTENQIKELFKIHFLYIALLHLQISWYHESSIKQVYFYNPWNRFTVFIQMDMLVVLQQWAHIAILTLWGKAEKARHYHSSQKGIGNTYWNHNTGKPRTSILSWSNIQKTRCESSLPCLDQRSLNTSLKTWKTIAGEAALDWDRKPAKTL